MSRRPQHRPAALQASLDVLEARGLPLAAIDILSSGDYRIHLTPPPAPEDDVDRAFRQHEARHGQS